jgi:hypothetical protein
VGSTRYLGQWLTAVEKLEPDKIVVSIDDSRHEDIAKGFSGELIHYDTGKGWRSYDTRHENYISDYSIGLGIKNLILYFLESDCDHFICLDSDVILDEGIVAKIRNSDYDYLQIGVPVINRKGLKVPYIFWKSTNFGLNKDIAKKLYPKLDYEIENAKPVDLKLHDMIRSCIPEARLKIKSRGLAHYFNRNGRNRRISTLEAEMKAIYCRPLLLIYGLFHTPIYPTRNN